jgi:hypothetical protein
VPFTIFLPLASYVSLLSQCAEMFGVCALGLRGISLLAMSSQLVSSILKYMTTLAVRLYL